MSRLEKHHVLPSSRHGSNRKDNIAIIDRAKHRIYHQLFKNKTPVEIICYLVEYFWKNQWYHIENALIRRKGVR